MRLNLLIADHFDTLASGKILAVGLFTDRIVMLQTPAGVPAPTPARPHGADLALLLTLMDVPAGPLQGEVRVLPPQPGAEPVMRAPFKGVLTETGVGINVPIQLRPLLVPAVGMFTVEVQVNDQLLREQFEVRLRQRVDEPMPALEPPPVKRRTRRVKT